MEPDGELVSVDSRRQDQYAARNISLFYLQYRYMAIRDNNNNFAAIAKQIAGMKDFREAVLDMSLFYFMENSSLQKELPAADRLPAFAQGCRPETRPPRGGARICRSPESPVRARSQ